MSVDPTKKVKGGKSLGSGVRARQGVDSQSPASGVRSAGDGELLKPTPSVALQPGRPRMESEAGLTRIGPPPPSLLALARGEEEEKETAGAVSAPAKTRPLLWFCLGLVLGAGGIWGAKCDVAGDVYRARAWVASSLRAVRAAGKSAGNPTRVAIEAPVASVIPTVDVTELPRAREERPQKPSAAPASVATPPTPGAPALPHAPGPR